MMYDNPWRKFSISVHQYPGGQIYKFVRTICPPSIKNEVRHISSGDIKKDLHVYNVNDEFCVAWFIPHYYHDRNTDKKPIYYPIAECEWRYDDKAYQRLMKVKDILQVGDFVKCVGTRSGDWNIVENIKDWSMAGRKYSKPKLGCEKNTFSENNLANVRKIVRDGKEIL